MEKKRIGILGGSFDPPTIAHLQVAAQALNSIKSKINEVWIIPCGERPDKKLANSGPVRLEMLELAIKDMFPKDINIKINDIEIRNKATIPTYHLMKKLEELHPENEFYFIAGTDLIPSLLTWDEGCKLIEEIRFLITERPGFEIDFTEEQVFLTPKHYEIMEGSFILGVISSTEIRKRIKICREGKEDIGIGDNAARAKYLCISGLVTKSVLEFIVENKLYA